MHLDNWEYEIFKNAKLTLALNDEKTDKAVADLKAACITMIDLFKRVCDDGLLSLSDFVKELPDTDINKFLVIGAEIIADCGDSAMLDMVLTNQLVLADESNFDTYIKHMIAVLLTFIEAGTELSILQTVMLSYMPGDKVVDFSVWLMEECTKEA